MDYQELANLLIDYLIDINGLGETIQWLLDSGYTKKELVEELSFDSTAVEEGGVE